MGRDRLVRLEAQGGGIGATRLAILTRATPDSVQPHGTIAAREGLAESTYYAGFTHGFDGLNHPPNTAGGIAVAWYEIGRTTGSQFRKAEGGHDKPESDDG